LVHTILLTLLNGHQQRKNHPPNQLAIRSVYRTTHH